MFLIYIRPIKNSKYMFLILYYLCKCRICTVFKKILEKKFFFQFLEEVLNYAYENYLKNLKTF